MIVLFLYGTYLNTIEEEKQNFILSSYISKKKDFKKLLCISFLPSQSVYSTDLEGKSLTNQNHYDDCANSTNEKDP